MDASEPRPPAPAPLALVQVFVNTVDLEELTDQLGSPQQARAWLGAHGVMENPPVSNAVLEHLTAVREALRGLLMAHGRPGDAENAALRLDRLLTGVRLHPVVGVTGITLEPVAPGVDGFLGRLAAAVAVAGIDGTWERLKVCRDGTCSWAFYDHSKNGRGTWCSMRSCGSRAKARAYRARQRSGDVPDDGGQGAASR